MLNDLRNVKMRDGTDYDEMLFATADLLKWVVLKKAELFDVNGDGFADVVVGAPNNDDGSTDAGKVYVFEGTPDGMSETASHGQYGESSGNNLGQRLYSLGDINGDDYGDVYMAGDSGEARVYHGSVSGLTGVADQRWSRTELVAIGDINAAKGAYMELFRNDQSLADQLLVAMEAWLSQQADGSAETAEIGGFSEWLVERRQLAGITRDVSLIESRQW